MIRPAVISQSENVSHITSGGLPIDEIGDKSARETGDGKRHQYRMNWLSAEGHVHPVRCVAAGGYRTVIAIPFGYPRSTPSVVHGEMDPTIVRRFIRMFTLVSEEHT